MSELESVESGNGHNETPITIAADVLPDRVEPVQATLPGVRPIFDIGAALDMIEEAEGAASNAEFEYANAVEVAKLKRKRADAANAHLRELIQDLNQRRHEARYEPPSQASTETDHDARVDEPVLDAGSSGPVDPDASASELVSGSPAVEPSEDTRDADVEVSAPSTVVSARPRKGRRRTQ